MGVEPERKRLVVVQCTLRHAPYGELRSMYVDVDVDVLRNDPCSGVKLPEFLLFQVN